MTNIIDKNIILTNITLTNLIGKFLTTYLVCIKGRMSVISGDTVKGSFHQGDSLHFSHETLGRQCMANAVAAAVYATMLPVHLWDTSSLDRILLAGDDLYRRKMQ